jgi:thymidylate kinase
VTEAFFACRPLVGQRRLRRSVEAELAAWRMDGALEAALRQGFRTAFWAAGALNSRVLHAPRPWSRRAPGGGCIIAVLGVDGSGKSTAVRSLRDWLGTETDVLPIYFGTGDGRPSLMLLPFKLLSRVIAQVVKTRPKGSSHGKVSDNAPGRMYSLLLMIWAAAVAAEKKGKLLKARRAAERGLIVVADRYPQNENPCYSDGPLLHRLAWAPGWLRRFEARTYELAARLPPDLVIKLSVRPETSARREPNMDGAVIRQRIEAARQLQFAGAKIVSIDAEQPLADVLRAIKREVWQTL